MSAMSANPYDVGPFRQVCDMEHPLRVVQDLIAGIAMIGETIGDAEGAAICQIAWIAHGHCKEVEKVRGELFALTHPDAGNRRAAT